MCTHIHAHKRSPFHVILTINMRANLVVDLTLLKLPGQTRKDPLMCTYVFQCMATCTQVIQAVRTYVTAVQMHMCACICIYVHIHLNVWTLMPLSARLPNDKALFNMT